jgi:hypothetical protein
MASFDLIIKDIQSLKGRRLKSIKPGADVILIDVDLKGKRLILLSSSGVSRSRPFSEIESIVKALNSDGIVHVDTVLAGSGSSRNQPETILANLPYIDFTFIDRKKHLVIRDEPSHQIGILNELDLLEARRIVDRFKSRQRILPTQIIVTSKLREATSALTALGGDLKALSPVLYSISVQNRLIWIVSPSALNCSAEGAYALILGTPSTNAKAVGTLFGNRLFEEPNSYTCVLQPD